MARSLIAATPWAGSLFLHAPGAVQFVAAGVMSGFILYRRLRLDEQRTRDRRRRQPTT